MLWHLSNDSDQWEHPLPCTLRLQYRGPPCLLYMQNVQVARVRLQFSLQQNSRLWLCRLGKHDELNKGRLSLIESLGIYYIAVLCFYLLELSVQLTKNVTHWCMGCMKCSGHARWLNEPLLLCNNCSLIHVFLMQIKRLCASWPCQIIARKIHAADHSPSSGTKTLFFSQQCLPYLCVVSITSQQNNFRSLNLNFNPTTNLLILHYRSAYSRCSKDVQTPEWQCFKTILPR